MKRKRSTFYISQAQSSSSNNNNNNKNIKSSNSNQPKCTICLQEYTNRTFVRNCYHSFCFSCIKQWINIVPECPLCKRTILSLVYNIVEETNTFTEYPLNLSSTSSKKHNPPSLPPLHTQRQTLTTRWQHKRKLLYQQIPTSKVISYPPPLYRFNSFTVIQPDHMPKNELYILIGSAYDAFIEEHVKNILLIPYHTNTNNNNSNSSNNIKRYNKMTMYDDIIIQQLSELIDENEQIIIRWMDELLAYLKSGLTYMTFINATQYEYHDDEHDDEYEGDGDGDEEEEEEKEKEEEEDINDHEKEETGQNEQEKNQQEATKMNDDNEHISLSPSISFISISPSTPSTSNS
ncbi:unnamed protein product [Cunninghamella echinulata]